MQVARLFVRKKKKGCPSFGMHFLLQNWKENNAVMEEYTIRARARRVAAVISGPEGGQSEN
jgi:hypothetical protein